MIHKIPVYVEGDIDEILFNHINEYLAFKYFNFQKQFKILKSRSISQVLNKNIDNNCEISIGIIDNDKTKSNNFDKYSECKNLEKTIYLHQNNSKFLVVLDKAVEDWLNHNEKFTNIARVNYGFPMNYKYLKNNVKSKKQKNDFLIYLKDLFENNPYPLKFLISALYKVAKSIN